MRIASLAPYLTDTLRSLDLGAQLVAVTAQCAQDDAWKDAVRITLPDREGESLDLAALSRAGAALGALKAARPEVVVLDLVESDDAAAVARVRTAIQDAVGSEVRVVTVHPCTLEQIYQTIEELGKHCGAAAQGRALVGRIKAQFMDWGDNFYERTKNKRVTFISSLEPLCIAGLWIPDLVGLASAISQSPSDGKPDRGARWEEILEFRPDVMVIAPRGYDLQQSMRSFKTLEKLPVWEQIPAVKRGEVIFCSGTEFFYQPSARLRGSMAILISAIAGFDSGYITDRDTFFRLRWLEMQRHRL